MKIDVPNEVVELLQGCGQTPEDAMRDHVAGLVDALKGEGISVPNSVDAWCRR